MPLATLEARRGRLARCARAAHPARRPVDRTRRAWTRRHGGGSETACSGNGRPRRAAEAVRPSGRLPAGPTAHEGGKLERGPGRTGCTADRGRRPCRAWQPSSTCSSPPATSGGPTATPSSNPCAGRWPPTRTSLAARVALANAHLTAGRIEDALKEYQTAAKSPYAGLGVAGRRYTRLRIAIGPAGGRPGRRVEGDRVISAKAPRAGPAGRRADGPDGRVLAARGDFAAARRCCATRRRPGRATRGCGRPWPAVAGPWLGAPWRPPEAVSEGQVATGESVGLRLARARLWADDLQPGRARRLARLEELPPIGRRRRAEPAHGRAG